MMTTRGRTRRSRVPRSRRAPAPSTSTFSTSTAVISCSAKIESSVRTSTSIAVDHLDVSSRPSAIAPSSVAQGSALGDVERRPAVRRADRDADVEVVRPVPLEEREPRRLRLDVDAAPAALVQRARHRVVARIERTDVDVEPRSLRPEGAPENDVLAVLGVGYEQSRSSASGVGMGTCPARTRRPSRDSNPGDPAVAAALDLAGGHDDHRRRRPAGSPSRRPPAATPGRRRASSPTSRRAALARVAGPASVPARTAPPT